MIHSTAIISDTAIIADDVEIGAYCVIGDGVEIDSGTKVDSHVVINGPTRIGKDNHFLVSGVHDADTWNRAKLFACQGPLALH